MSNSAAARVKRRRTGEEDVVDGHADDKHPNCSSICLVTLSEKLRFLSDKNYDAFGANHVMLNISNIPTTHGTQHILIEVSIAQGNAEHYYTELCYKSTASVLQKQAVGGLLLCRFLR